MALSGYILIYYKHCLIFLFGVARQLHGFCLIMIFIYYLALFYLLNCSSNLTVMLGWGCLLYPSRPVSLLDHLCWACYQFLIKLCHLINFVELLKWQCAQGGAHSQISPFGGYVLPALQTELNITAIPLKLHSVKGINVSFRYDKKA